MPDLSPTDFAIFPKMKNQPKGCRFDTTAEIQHESQEGALMHLEEKASRTHSSSGGNAGSAVLLCKGIIFEGDSVQT